MVWKDEICGDEREGVRKSGPQGITCVVVYILKGHRGNYAKFGSKCLVGYEFNWKHIDRLEHHIQDNRNKCNNCKLIKNIMNYWVWIFEFNQIIFLCTQNTTPILDLSQPIIYKKETTQRIKLNVAIIHSSLDVNNVLLIYNCILFIFYNK